MPPKTLTDIYKALAQSVITYCLPAWGGATKIKFLELERAQRSLLKVMYFKPFRFPTNELYRISGLLSVRKLYILSLILYLHRHIPVNLEKQSRRRKIGMVVHSLGVHTAFARRQYMCQSAYIYNKVNAILHFHLDVPHKCNLLITEWLQSLTYDETEQLLVRLV